MPASWVLWKLLGSPPPGTVAPVGPGEGSVWDYPRPPSVREESREVGVWFGGERVAWSERVVVVRETAGAPVFFLPIGAVREGALEASGRSSVCEWKGAASYFDVLAGGRRAASGAFMYPEPTEGFEALRGCVAFYAGAMERVEVDGEVARPQEGGFYAGWVLSWVKGPIKGAPGTGMW